MSHVLEKEGKRAMRIIFSHQKVLKFSLFKGGQVTMCLTDASDVTYSSPTSAQVKSKQSYRENTGNLNIFLK